MYQILYNCTILNNGYLEFKATIAIWVLKQIYPVDKECNILSYYKTIPYATILFTISSNNDKAAKINYRCLKKI